MLNPELFFNILKKENINNHKELKNLKQNYLKNLTHEKKKNPGKNLELRNLLTKIVVGKPLNANFLATTKFLSKYNSKLPIFNSLKNSVKKGVLHCVNGAFSSKWVKVSESCGYNHNVINYEWGKGVKAEDVDQYLSSGKYLKYSFTGIFTPTSSKLFRITCLIIEFNEFQSNIIIPLVHTKIRVGVKYIFNLMF